jgi:hypothetical protein
MKKLTFLTVLLVGALLCFTSGASAQSSGDTFPITVAIDNASTATFAVYQIDAADTFTSWGSNTLEFNPTLEDVTGPNPGDPVQYAYLGDVYYAIDVFPYGAGALNVTLSYTDDSNPNGGANDGTGLGAHAIATPTAHDDNGTPGDYTDDADNPIGSRATLENIAQTVLASEILANGQYFRLYVGLATGNDTEPAPEPVTPFSPADTPGNYTGTLTMTVAPPGP